MSNSPNPDSIAAKKRRMTLNLASSPGKHGAKQVSPKGVPFLPPHLTEHRPSPVLLTSPDLRMFTISTPEVERMLIQGLIGPKTPSPTLLPSGAGAPKSPTTVAEERDLYTKGFADAMAYSSSLHAAAMNSVIMEGRASANYPLYPGNGGYMLPAIPAHQQQPVSPMHGFKILPLPHLVVGSPLGSPVEERSLTAFLPRSSGSMNFDSYDRASHSPSVSMSDQLSLSDSCAQTVPSPGGSSVSSRSDYHNDAVSAVSDALMDVDASCKERNDVRRERNRVAAARCRQRKVDKIWILEDRVKELRHQNEVLLQYSEGLRVVLQKLKTELRMHLRSGCQVDFEGPH